MILYLSAGCLISLGLAIAGWPQIALGFLLGIGGAFVYIILLKRQVVRIVRGGPQEAKKRAISGLFIRYGFIVILLAVAARVGGINLLSVLGGLITIPLGAIISSGSRK